MGAGALVSAWGRAQKREKLDVSAGARSAQPDLLAHFCPGVPPAARRPPRTPAQRSTLLGSVPVELSLK